LLLRHALSISDNEGNDDDASTMFSVSLVFSLYLSLPIILLVPCVDLNHCSCRSGFITLPPTSLLEQPVEVY
jgi:hypothetical protein